MREVKKCAWQKIGVVHKISKLSEVHDPVVRLLLTKNPAGMNWAILQKRANFTKNANFGNFTKKEIWKLCGFFLMLLDI